MPLIFFYNPEIRRQSEVFCCFQGIQKKTNGMKWIKKHNISCKIEDNQISAGIYLLKFNNRYTRTRREICSKLTIKTQERRHDVVMGLYC